MSDTLLPEELLSHAGWMRSLARGLVIDEARAEDVVQEAFAVVAERRPLRPGSVGGWLRGVVQNLARRSRREETRRRRREEAAARPESCPPSHAELLDRAELQRCVVDCVIELPEPYRATILARYFNDMQAGDIAARDRVPVATVRTRLQRGLERLRRALDQRHGGDRETWRALLLPLAATGLWAGSAAAAQAPSGVTGASAAFTGPASGAAASAITKFSIGGALLAHKTIIVAAGATIISLAVGLGFGRSAARHSPEQAGGRLPSADSARVAELEARLEETQRRAAADAAKADREAAALASRLKALDAELREARAGSAPAAAKDSPPPIAVPFGKWSDLPALREADWGALAGAIKEMNALTLESLEKREKGETAGDELTSRLAAETAKLSKFSMELMGKIPTQAPFNGEFTHPLVVANLTGALLEAAGMPLSEAQGAAIARLGEDYERQYDERQADYGGDTPALKRILDEYELKQNCLRGLRDQLTPEQREEIVPSRLEDRLQSDLLSAGAATFFLLKQSSYPSAQAAREDFQSSAFKGLGLTPEQTAALGPAFDAWYQEAKPLLSPQKPTHLSPPLDAVLQAGRAYQGLIERALELPNLDAKTRKALLEQRQWSLPQVVENE